MNKGIIKMLNTTAGLLGFSLFSGCGYFAVILKFIIDMSNGSAFLALMFSPLIICGAALVIVRLLKQHREAENESAMLRIFWLHIVIAAIGAVFLAAALK